MPTMDEPPSVPLLQDSGFTQFQLHTSLPTIVGQNPYVIQFHGKPSDVLPAPDFKIFDFDLQLTHGLKLGPEHLLKVVPPDEFQTSNPKGFDVSVFQEELGHTFQVSALIGKHRLPDYRFWCRRLGWFSSHCSEARKLDEAADQ